VATQMFVGAVLAIILHANSASAEETNARRYSLQGVATLTLDAPVLQSESLQLRSLLSPDSKPLARASQSGDRFALTAKFAATVQVCYNDTIFRDDFDGDGL
jgi:hypothetical protein